jgi:hypothetical protein
MGIFQQFIDEIKLSSWIQILVCIKKGQHVKHMIFDYL